MMCFMSAPDWDKDGSDWPHRDASRFVRAGGITWHVQVMGEGPVLLLVHGTGAASHSWRDLMAPLAERFTVVVPDLPGHGFSETPPSRLLSLPGMARALDGLLNALDLKPDLAAGHSAGVAVLLRMILDGRIAPNGLVGVNGALKPFGGAAGFLFPTMAKALFLNPAMPRIVAWSARDRGRVERLIADTGSALDPRGLMLYQRLFSSPAHVSCTLGMMAHWNLRPLLKDLTGLRTPLLLVTGDGDRAIPPAVAHDLHARLRHTELACLPGLGHLAHEERPDDVVDLIIRHGQSQGLAL